MRRQRIRRAGEVSVALVGLGYWGPNLLRNLLEIDGVSVDALCDADADVLGAYARGHRRPRLTTDFDELVVDDSLDAVLIATPFATHYELARRGLEAGKHVLVEKPLAATVAQACELRDLAADRGLVVMPGHTFLYSPAVLAVRQLLESDELGRIYFGTSSRVNLGPYRRDATVVQDLAPHDFSILLYWLGAPSSVRAVGRDAIVDGRLDIAFIDVAYPDGCLIHLDLSWLAPTKLRRTVLVGERKMIEYHDTSSEPLRLYDRGIERVEPHTFGEFQLAYRSGDVHVPHLEPVEPLRLELADFITAVRTGRAPRSHVDLGIDVLRMVQAAEESLADSGTSVRLALQERPPALSGSPR